ncbi:MAG: DUF58 domain-containing protein [Nocardioides sp.]
MRESLRSLTARGRAFLALGAGVFVGGLVIGDSMLIRVSAFIAVLPLLSAAFVGRHRYRLALVRTVTPQVVAAGQSAEVTLTLTNEGKAPNGVLLLEEQLPYVLGARPRFALSGIGPGWRREVSYLVRSEVRGRYDVGPMTVRMTDPFGLVELGRAFRATVPVTVTPRTTTLPSIPLSGASTGSGDNRPRAFAVGSAEDVTVREYRRGDDLRRVHWRSSARLGELMVRREEQPWQSRATVFVDNRTAAHRGDGLTSSFEDAVSAAASVAVHLSQRGFLVRLVTASGERESAGWHVRDARMNARPLLESLAVLLPTTRENIDCQWLNESGHSGVTVAVFGSLTSQDSAALRRMSRSASTALAIVLDVNRWHSTSLAAGDSKAPAISTLATQGWRTGVLGPAERLESVWRDLGRGQAGLGVGEPHFAPTGLVR